MPGGPKGARRGGPDGGKGSGQCQRPFYFLEAGSCCLLVSSYDQHSPQLRAAITTTMSASVTCANGFGLVIPAGEAGGGVYLARL